MEESQAETQKPVEFVVIADGVTASDYALKNLNAALGKAQTEFTPAVKDAVNAYGAYKYVPLENIIASTRPALAKNHLTVMQFPFADLGHKTVTLTTRIVHWDSGEWIQNVLDVPGELALGKDGALKFNQQTIGGGVTYARKIAYKPIVGVSDSDDDIDAGGEQPSIQSSAPKRQQNPPRQAAPAQKSQSKAAEQPADKGIFKLMPGGLLTCIIKGVQEKEKPSKDDPEKMKRYAVVFFNDFFVPEGSQASVNHGFCDDIGLFEALNAGIGKECQLKIEISNGVVLIRDFLFCDGVEYVDGKPFVKK